MNLNDLTDYHKRELRTSSRRVRQFRWTNLPGWAGFAFDVDENGEFAGAEIALENWKFCLAGDPNLEDLGVKIETEEWYEPASGLCSCGTRVSLTNGLENVCPNCGNCYNASGQKVLGRAAWERAGGSSLAGEVWDEED